MNKIATYSVKEAASILGVSNTTMYQFVKSGFVPCFRVGARYFIPKKRFENWIENLGEEEEAFYDNH